MIRLAPRRAVENLVATGLAVLAVTSMLVGAAAAPEDAGTPLGAVVPASAGAAPNVLVINLDDATEKMLDWTQPTGDWVMPRVQGLKEEAAVFSNAFVDIPSCCPSRFSTFTGRYPHNTGGKLQADATELPVRETFVHHLREAGYATAMSGKFLVSWPIGTPPPTYERYTVTKGRYRNPDLNRNGVVAAVQGYSTKLLAGDLRSYLTEFEADDDRPWFAYWAPHAPHTDGGFKSLAVPTAANGDVDMGTCAQPIEVDRADKPPYVSFVAPDAAHNQALCTSQLQALMTVDRQLGSILDQLKDMREYRNTMVVLTSDNGYHWGEIGWFSKFYPYEPSIGIPLYVKWPAALQRQPGVDNRLASSLDLTRTILAVADVASPVALDGDSLLEPAHRTEIFVEYFQDPDNGDMGTWAALRGTDWKYIESSQVSSSGVVTEFTEYYDLASDPDESDNVLQDRVRGNEPPAEVLAALSERLDEARRCAGARCP